MKYLVTGGAGFIGSHLCDALINRGDSVVVLDNFSTGNTKNVEHLSINRSFELIEGSILDVDIVDKAVESVDHVLHLAAAVGVFTILDRPLESLTTNLRGTENILEAAKRETEEETGHKPNNLKLIYSFNPSTGMSNQTVHVVFGKITDKPRINFDTDEVKNIKWLSETEVKKLIKKRKIADGISLISLLLHFS